MASRKAEPGFMKHSIVLVQGEAFRCLAVEVEPGRWRRVPDGAHLPTVLDVVRIVRACDGFCKDKHGVCALTGKRCRSGELN